MQKLTLMAFLYLANSLFAASNRIQDEVIFKGWGPLSDSIYYLETDQDKFNFDKYWKFKNIRHVYAACGYTYEVLKSNKIEPSKNIASVNLDCGLIEVDSGTYFGQMKPAIKALKTARAGYRKLDTLIDSATIDAWLQLANKNANFLGYRYFREGCRYRIQAQMPKTRDSTFPGDNDTIESFRNFYAKIRKASGIRYEEISNFNVCTGPFTSNNTFNVCVNNGSEVVKALILAGVKIDTVRIGHIIEGFYKLRRTK